MCSSHIYRKELIFRGFYSQQETGVWINQRRTARIIQKDDKFYFNKNHSDINDFVLESIGDPSSPACSYQTIDGTKIDSGAMTVKFAYNVWMDNEEHIKILKLN